MRQGSTNGRFSAGNPIANALVVIVGVLTIGASIVLGFFAFVVLSSIILVMAAIIGIRLWWFNRKLQRTSPGDSRPSTPPAPGGVIEGEYVVVDEDNDKS